VPIAMRTFYVPSLWITHLFRAGIQSFTTGCYATSAQ
jgi:hypothetical protein